LVKQIISHILTVARQSICGFSCMARYQRYRATSSALSMAAAVASKTLILLLPNYMVLQRRL